MKVNAIQKIVISLIALSAYLLASTQDCLSNIDQEKLKEELYTNGTFLTKKCAYTYPYLFITITNLDDPENIISITHAPKESDGYPLKTITEHAQRESGVTGKETILAINGFTWLGDSGFFGGYAERPTGTVYSKGSELYTRTTTGEAIIAFSRSDNNGTKAKLYDRSNGEEIDKTFTHNLDNTTTSILKHGIAYNADAEYRTSSMGIGRYDGKNVLIVLSPLTGTDPIQLQEHIEIFQFFKATDAIRLDGNSASSLYFGGKYRNGNNIGFQLSDGQRSIMYALTVSRKSDLSREILNDGYDRGDVQDGLDRSFVKHNNTVIDKTLSLMWQNYYDDPYGKEWQEALAYCEALDLDGYVDWRLPSIKELQTLVNYNEHNPAVESNLWSNLQYEIIGSYAPGYWSSTKYHKYQNSDAWRITYYNGFIEKDSLSDHNFVRCVRGLQEGVGSYERNSNGIVKDTTTGLEWQDHYISDIKETSWNKAIEYCDDLQLASFEDWRLPTINELYSIVDFNRSSPAMDDTVFETMGAYHYWTSTKNDASSGNSRAIYLNYDGTNIGSNTSNYNFVRCVRGAHTDLDIELNID